MSGKQEADAFGGKMWLLVLGAGASMGPPAELPAFVPVRDAILRALGWLRVPGGYERPKPLVDQVPAKAVPIQSAPAPGPPVAASPQAGFEQAAAGLIETGVRFLESFAAMAQSAPTGEGLSSLISRDPHTNRPVLSIPLPQSIDQDRLTRAISAILGAFGAERNLRD
jgi:hypothetical protein